MQIVDQHLRDPKHSKRPNTLSVLNRNWTMNSSTDQQHQSNNVNNSNSNSNAGLMSKALAGFGAQASKPGAGKAPNPIGAAVIAAAAAQSKASAGAQNLSKSTQGRIFLFFSNLRFSYGRFLPDDCAIGSSFRGFVMSKHFSCAWGLHRRQASSATLLCMTELPGLEAPLVN